MLIVGLWHVRILLQREETSVKDVLSNLILFSFGLFKCERKRKKESEGGGGDRISYDLKIYILDFLKFRISTMLFAYTMPNRCRIK